MSREKWNRRYSEKELLWPEHPSSILVDEVEGLKPGKALDIAAGEGRNALWLAKQGWDVHAVDFSDVGVQKGRELARKAGLELSWEVADVTEYTPSPGRYDLVIIFYLHLPWPELSGVFQGAAAAVAPGGELLIVGHDVTNLTKGFGGPQDPDVLYTADQVASMLPDLKSEKAVTIERPVDHEHGTGSDMKEAAAEAPTAVDCLVRAKRNFTKKV